MLSNGKVIAIPPGATIKEQMQDRKWSKKKLAEVMSLSKDIISDLIDGDTELTDTIAAKLQLVFGIPSTFWILSEKMYREDLRKISKGI